MRIELKDIIAELTNQQPQIDPQKLDEQKAIVKQLLIDKQILPLNETLAEMAVNFIANINLKPILRHQIKGLFVSGGVGTGKTVSLKIIASICGFKFFYATDIKRHLEFNDMTIEQVFKTESRLIIDDIGTESTVNEFGVKFELMEKLIIFRHRQFLEKGFITCFSSNLSKNDFINRYGLRSYSRINEMCEIFTCNGKDLRIK